jgi:ABC-type Zn uptake system ZnuABC Zn-binding protein ZnuA
VKNTARRPLFALVTLPVLLFAVSGCRPTTTVTLEHAEGDHHTDGMPSLSPVTLSEGEKLQVVATTSIVADVVQKVGGVLIDQTTLLPLGTDPHAFEPTPQDVAAVADTHVVFANGAGLEVFLEPLLESTGEDATVVPVSYGIALLQLEDAHEREEEEEKEDEHDYGDGADPHTWFDPHNVIVWTHNVVHALSALDPDNAAVYEANGSAYEAELQELDAWIREQLAQVPEKNRKLVTDHATFSYFAQQYGFQQLGAVFPGYSTLAEPSAQDLAELEDAIHEFDVRAVFVGLTISPHLAERVADDTGVQLVFLYSGSLGEPGGPADDYLSFMRYNVSAIAEALH